MHNRLSGKVAVTTGGASGIGAATVRQFVDEGAHVVIADIQDGPGGELAAELGAQATFVHTDVSVEADVARAIATACEHFGRLDVLFNNAGFGGATGPLEETTSDDYDRTMNVLLKSVFFGIKHASPIMKRQRAGSIISTSSVCGLTAGIGAHLYTVAKAGVIMLTKTAALELAEWQVRVNAVCPGYVATSLAAGGSLTDLGPETTARRLDAVRERLGNSQPIARMGEVGDIAEVVTFLASDASSWITGTAQVVDGGLTLGKPWRRQPSAATQHRPL